RAPERGRRGPRSDLARGAGRSARPLARERAAPRALRAGGAGVKRETRLVRHDVAPEDPWRPLSTPIYQTACFAQPSATEFGAYDYTRSGNPTRAVLERELAELEGAACASAFASGMAALTAVTRLV